MKKTPYPSEVQERFIVRLPDGMRDRIAEEATNNNRSMNAEIVARLEQSFSTNTLDVVNDLIHTLKNSSEGAYRRGYHQAVAEVASYIGGKLITNAEQLNVWVEGKGMEWRKDMPLNRMTPPPPLAE